MTTTVPKLAASRERIVRHEAAHAAADILAGMIPHKIEVGPTSGAVTHDWQNHSIGDRDLARGLLRSTLAGPLADGRAPSWPLQRTKSEDEKSMAALADYLGLDRAGYEWAVIDTLKLMRSKEFRRLAHLFEHTLGDLGIPSLDRDQITQLLVATGLDQHLKGGPMDGVPMIEVVDRDGRPMRVRADWEPWWEKDEALAAGVAKAFDAEGEQAAMRNGKTPPIKIKKFRI